MVVLLGVALHNPPARSDDADVLARMRQRERALAKLYVEIDWLRFRVPIRKDPFDRANWNLKDVYQRDERYWIVRPHFKRWGCGPSAGPGSAPRCGWHNWLNGKHHYYAQEPDGSYSVMINPTRWITHGPEPKLTPLEMQLFDEQRSLLEVMEQGGLRVEKEDEEEVVLVGTAPPRPDGQPSQSWEIRAVLDPRRDLLPLEIHTELPVGKRGRIYWTMRTWDAVPVGGVFAIREAAISLSTPGQDWQLYHFFARTLRRDESLTRESLALEFPTRRIRLIDHTTGLIRNTDEQGNVIYEERVPLEELERRDQIIQQTAVQAALGRKAQRERQSTFLWMVAGCALLTIAAGGIAIWRRRRASA